METDQTIYKRRIPLLGGVKCDAKGHYYVAEHSVVAKAVGFRCPKCGKPILVRPSVAGRLTAICKKCATPVIFFVDASPSPKASTASTSSTTSTSSTSSVLNHPVPPSPTPNRSVPPSPPPSPTPNRPLPPSPPSTPTSGEVVVRPLTPAKLVLGHWPHRQELPLREGRTTIGRKDVAHHSDIEIDDPKASACSVCIMAMPVSGVSSVAPVQSHVKYEYRLQVLHATNPVFVNGIVVSPGGVVRLVSGTSLRLGNTKIVFKCSS